MILMMGWRGKGIERRLVLDVIWSLNELLRTLSMHLPAQATATIEASGELNMIPLDPIAGR